MNKAFTRESDDTEIRCPLCESAGVRVSEPALVEYVSTEIRQRLGQAVYFCETPSCDAVYFDAVEDCIRREELLKPVYPKDLRAPICACFGLTVDDIEDDVDEGKPRRVRETLARAKSDDAQCERLSPTGQSCAAEVQKYYMRRWSKRK